MRNSATLLLAAALAGATGTAMAAGSVYDKYIDWQWTPNVIADTNAADNVRHQNDMTVPLHGPWLTLPSETGMSVTWITRVPCAGGIEYREKGTTNWVERWQVKYGQIDYTRDIQNFHLDGLKPGTEYEYRLLSNLGSFATPYHMVLSRGREIYSFKTVDPKRDHYKVFTTSDIHGGFRLGLDPMIDRTDSADADFFFILGDNVEDGAYNNLRFYVTFGYLDDITRKWGREKPTIFMRGNHDVWGEKAQEYGDYFPQPDGKTYYAFRQGPCFFVALDTMWPPREALQARQWKAYLAEQAEWLKGLKKTPGWKTAKFRVVMFHVPMFPGEGMAFPYETFGEILADDSRDGRVHAVLTGHEHLYARVNPNTKEGRFNNAYGDFKLDGPKAYPPAWFCKSAFPEKFPYVSVVYDCGGVVTIDVSPEKLVFKAHRWDKPEGGLYDAFEISPDGKVKDLVDATVVPWPQPEAK